MKNKYDVFTKNEWDHLHDVILEATWDTTKRNCSREELIEIYEELPDHLKSLALEWGI